MGIVRTIARNTAALAVAQIAYQLSSLVLSILLARYLGENDYGVYVFAFAVASLAFIIADFSLGMILIVEVSRQKEIAPQYVANTLFLRLVLGAISIVVVIVFTWLRALPLIAAFSLIIIAFSTLMNFLSTVFAYTFNAFEKMHYILFTSLIERAFTVTVSAALVMSGFGLEYVVLVNLIGSLFNFIVTYLVLTKFVVKLEAKVSIPAAISELRRAIPFASAVIFTTTLYTVNMILVQSWSGNAAAAFYGVGYNLGVAVIALPGFFVGAILPVTSQLYRSSMDMVRVLQQKTMKFLFSLGLPMAIGGVLLGDKIILFFYGSEYEPAIGVFQLLSVAIAVVYFSSGAGNILASANLMRLSTIGAGISAGVNLVACIILIPMYAQYGAAAAFLLGIISMAIAGQYYLSRHVFRLNYKDITLKPIIASAGMALVLFFFLREINVFVTIAVSIVVYFALFFSLKTLDAEDIEIIRKVFRK